ncbi:uncharacterized protein PHACADRAFT_249002 [Phanerochaete carnosa HHB-10118-sp]|uniref:Uncharacterized protein n=1 Tax=Phanerochaete carnosa (strain HHB-10118-sp) TaxID=650164 RepID=K5WIG8_PHACS|nr:uncharacterized protein PHACADRAFT_249002 [Phanerochaete carnosa HHB-10118-sp]EKM58889.1 hypothetical protein PHACADRAFT_249002 [Phanerochaete carnosa HHB-10118-sp]
MEDVISSERERAVAHRMISESDRAKWPYITMNGAGRLDDGHVFIGTTEAGARPLTLKHFTFSDSREPSVHCLCHSLSVDGKLLAASFNAGDILVWRLSDGLLVQCLQHQGHTDKVVSLSFSPNNRTLISGSEDESAIVWDVRSGRALLRLEGHIGSVSTVAYAPHGTFVATASHGGTSVKIWDASTGAYLYSFSASGRKSELAFSADGSRLYIELHRSCLVYDTRTYTHVTTLQQGSDEQRSWATSLQGDRMVAASRGQVKIRSEATGNQILTIDHPQKIGFSEPVATVAEQHRVVSTVFFLKKPGQNWENKNQLFPGCTLG